MIQHFWETVPGWSIDIGHIYVAAVREAPQEGAHFVELGSYLGQSASIMAVEIANSGKRIKFDCVDLWDDVQAVIDAQEWHEQRYVAPKVRDFLRNIAPVIDYIQPIQSDTADAAQMHADESVDFVFVDADHSEAGCRRDIVAWWPKVKKGGLMGGHDFTTQYPGVMTAVRTCFPEGFTIRGVCWLVRKE